MTHKLPFRVPGYPRANYATPHQEENIAFFGGQSFNGVSFTKGSMEKFAHFYGYELGPGSPTEKQLREEHEARVAAYEEERLAFAGLSKGSPEYRDARSEFASRWGHEPSTNKPPKQNIEEVRRFMDEGGKRDMMRDVVRDGSRIMAVLAPFLEKGEDPVKLVLRALSAYGCDVSDPYGFDEEDEDYDEE